ncbi:hemolysin activation protein [Staphylococcus sp. HMSC034G07]|nr:beta-class phenol-soluble modulin [Staphylococcus sp. HMSC034G07]MDW3831749.1 beta-class phenol-soluble modulin [Staphylococcus saprophyticus]MDW3968650.1 beta-class phenol-soluble modulin [Staphylococcus saprophyticus]OHO39082.1 hemolysin activation protein [Staphylococcus sp. HMSC034G07]OHO42377.1 hemolysin activation protein [Staphylococcus sp. HMSC034G07]
MSEIVNSLKEAIESGINQDWVTMGTSIADIVAKGVDFALGFVG